MKTDIRTEAELDAWLKSGGPAVILYLDLTARSSEIATKDLTGSAFLGCTIGADLAAAAAACNCLVLPPFAPTDETPFNPYSAGLYSPCELYQGYDPADPSTGQTYFDRKVFLSYMLVGPPPEYKPMGLKPVAADALLLRRMHDATIATALDEFVEQARGRIVAVMGGHDRPRDDKGVFLDVALMALEFARKGYVIATGGGPGLMEAANLGAYCAGFADPEGTLRDALRQLKTAAVFNDPDWLRVGYGVWRGMGAPIDRDRSRNLGIPTWFYGHEPPNLFATDIAKYFENSIREEGLLAIALSGVIFAEGNGGTVQEIFQDACQNYYRTYGKSKSPMVLLGTSYWNSAYSDYNDKKDKRRPLYPVLKKLAFEKDFADYVHITDSTAEAVDFIVRHPPTP